MRRELISHHQATREKTLVFARGSVRLEPLAPELHGRAPLGLAEIGEVFGLTWKAETHFERPQDVEWTYWGNILFVLQSRPITTDYSDQADTRRGYLSLHRSNRHFSLPIFFSVVGPLTTALSAFFISG
jgi:phosphoenolpyruvate synthase/pyruvate phosphate dikinase